MSNSDVTMVLRGGRELSGGRGNAEIQDVAIGADGRIAAIAPAIASPDAKSINIAGKIVVPGLVDAHQHLDKSRTRDIVRNERATLEGASAGYKKYAARATREEITDRAERTLRACLDRGTDAIRTPTNLSLIHNSSPTRR